MTADAFFLQYRPSSIAMAAVLVVVNELFDVQTDFPSFDDALDDLYSPSHIAEVAICPAIRTLSVTLLRHAED